MFRPVKSLISHSTRQPGESYKSITRLVCHWLSLTDHIRSSGMTINQLIGGGGGGFVWKGS